MASILTESSQNSLFNIQSIFSSDSVNVAGPLSKTTTKLMSMPIFLYLRIGLFLTLLKKVHFGKLQPPDEVLYKTFLKISEE